MAELLHANAIQQLEVALLGSPAAQILNLLAAGMRQPASTSQGSVVLPLKASTPMAPPPPNSYYSRHHWFLACCIWVFQWQ